jgi:hypothetical protein
MILRLCVTQILDRMFRGKRGDQHLIRTEEKITYGQAPSIGDPALRQVVGPVVHKVAALTERAEVCQPVVRRVAIEMCRCKHDTGRPKLCGLHRSGHRAMRPGDLARLPLLSRKGGRRCPPRSWVAQEVLFPDQSPGRTPVWDDQTMDVSRSLSDAGPGEGPRRVQSDRTRL